MMSQEFEIESIGVPDFTVDQRDNQIVYKLRVNGKTLNKKYVFSWYIADWAFETISYFLYFFKRGLIWFGVM